MPLPVNGAKFFCFGPFQLNSQTGELRRHGVRVRLPDQSCKVLLALLERPGELVTREELQQQLWTADTFVDFDHGLNLAVARLRQALGEAAEQSGFVETLPRRGYRLLTHVDVVPAQAPCIEVDHSGPARQVHVGITRILSWTAIVALVAGGIVLTVWRPSRTPEFVSATSLTGYTGAQLTPSFAPDGDRVAFSWAGEKQDNFDIYVKQIGMAGPLRLTTDPRPELSPAWSPDGRTIAFLRFSPGPAAEVVLIPSLVGGPERRLAEVAAPSLGYREMRLLTWSPDGKWLVASDAHPDFGLFLLSPETGEKRSLTSPPFGYDDFDPAFSPDMTRLLFVRHSGASAGDIYLVELTRDLSPAGPPKRMTFDNRPMASPVWTHDGRALVFSRYLLPGHHSLWKMTLSTPPRVEPLPISADNVFALAISPKGDRLIYTRNVRAASIWAIDSPDFQSAAAGTSGPRLLIASNREELSPAFSPDDRQIAFQSSRTGWNEIWAANRDGTHQHQVTELRGSIAGFPRWSPDGTQIVFHSRQESYPRLFLLDVMSGRARPLTYHAVAEIMPSWSHDGKWIYFGSVRNGDEQIWKVAAEGGAPIQLTRGGGGAPQESADGKFVIYAKGNGNLWRTPVSGGQEQQITTDSVAGYATAYGPAPKGIYFIRQASDAGPQSLVFLSYATGKITSIVNVPGTITIGFTVSADERTIMYAQTDLTTGDLMLVENFRGLKSASGFPWLHGRANIDNMGTPANPPKRASEARRKPATLISIR